MRRAPGFTATLARALERGLTAAALVDRDGEAIALAGPIGAEQAMPLAAIAMHQRKSPDLSERLFDGEIIAVTLDDFDVALGIAKRQLFVVALLPRGTSPALASVVSELRESIERLLPDSAPDLIEAMPWSGGGGGSGSGPAELSLVEWGLTVSRVRGKA